MDCGKEKCGGCQGCGGSREIVLTASEARLLRRLGQVAFLPIARRYDGEEPVCLEEGDPAVCGEALSWLHLKGLVSLDYDRPLTNFGYEAYGEYPVHGSAALTAMGQDALEALEIQGAED